MIGKDEEVELPELDKILTKYMTGESKRPLWPYLTEALQKCLIPLRRRKKYTGHFVFRCPLNCLHLVTCQGMQILLAD